MKGHERLAGASLALAFAGLLGVAVPAHASDDQTLLRGVSNAVLSSPRYGVFDSVGVRVQDGKVVLTGSVREPWLKDELEKRVAKVTGVTNLASEIRVQPLSFNDERLRLQIARSIYGSDLLGSYASWANPPVRIIVENGHVTLTGSVVSNVERQLAGIRARQTLAFSVDNQIELDSDRQGVDRKAS